MPVEFQGEPILIEFRPDLHAHRGKLVFGGDRGDPVHAGTFLRQRRIVLDAALLNNSSECDRILAHELFHFVWWKLGRVPRSAYETLVRNEIVAGIPGEMGWSAAWRKQRLLEADWRRGTRRYREYLCESFCDTAAACFLGLTRHDEFTLTAGAHRRRKSWMRHWMEDLLPKGSLNI